MALDKSNPVDRKEFAAMMQTGSSAATATTFGTVKKGATVAALTIAVGTPAAGTVDVTGSFSQSVLNNNFATVATQINSILTSLKNAGVMA